MKSSEILTRVYEFFRDNPTAWTKGQFARAADGRSVTTVSSKACQWCVGGRIHKEASNVGTSLLAWEWLAKQSRNGSVIEANDSDTFENMLKAVKRAARAAAKAGD